ncbi:MAG: AAA family ATPase [Gemmatimonadetes bacterium]|nr:AAA family ATPase [Gemmatimonadota bacterium]
MSDTLSITTLTAPGAPALEVRTPSGSALGPGKPFALLVYLACSPRCTAAREQLVDLLWADNDPDAARHALRQVTWYVRRRLGDGVLVTDGATLALRVPFTMDRDRFVAFVEGGDYAQAIAAYAGDFLPGFAVPGGGEFERWADLERQRLRSMFVRSAELMAREALLAGRYKDAQSLARRERDADPFNQAAWRLLLEALVSANDTLGAATESDRLEQLLQAEEIEPDPATRAAIRLARHPKVPEAQGDEHGPPPASGLIVDLIGREREFSRLLVAWGSARHGVAKHVHISAPAGLGKTRLVKDLHARLRAMRSRVVLVRANPGERTIPFAAAADVAASLAALPGAAGLAPAAAAALVALNPSLSSIYRVEPDTSTGDEALRRRSLAIAELARSVAEDAPLAILLDDVHWADDASLQVLAGAMPRLQDSRILLVSTSRPMQVPIAVRTESDPLVLEPLTVAQVQEFVTNVARLPEEGWCDSFAPSLHAATAGSPLLLLETLQLAMERGVLRVQDSRWVCDGPDDLAELLRAGSAVDRRIAPLGGDAAWLLLVLAVAGMPLPAEAAERIEANARDGLQELERRGLARRTAAGWLPEHDEIADAAVRRATPEQVRLAHRKLGHALASLLTDDSILRPIVTHHLVAGGDRDGVRALFVAQLRKARLAGDRRSTLEVAQSFLTHATDEMDASELASGAPWRLRTRSRWIATAAAAALLLVGAAIGARAFKGDEPVDVWVVGRADGTPVAQPIAPDAWRSGTAVELGAKNRPLLSAPEEMFNGVGREVVRIGSERWAITMESPDTGGIDIYLREPGGGTHRLTDHPADDAVDDVSPDLSTLLIASGRWNSNERSSVGLLDLRTNRITRLVSGDQLVGGGRWSPDGTRIAYSRAYYVPHAPELCVIAVDGTGERCREFADASWVQTVAWRDARTLLISVFGDSTTRLTLTDVATFEQQPVIEVRSVLDGSRDGRFVLARVSGGASQGERLVLLDLEHAKNPIALTVGGRSPSNFYATLVGGDRSGGRPYLAHLRIVAPPGGVPIDLPQRLRVEATDATGGATAVEVLSWRSLDTLVATVSPDGLLVPRSKGAVRVIASAGGWRADTARIEVVDPQAKLAMREEWTQLDTARWVPYGEPRPFVREIRGRRALLVNGDSSFESGVYERVWHRVGSGLALHAELSMPRSAAQWQEIAAIFMAPDSVALAKWNHVKGSEPIGLGDACGINMPHAEGYPGMTKGDAVAPAGGTRVFDAQWALRGAWVTIDVQIFPDGTCGVAVNGRPLVRSTGWVNVRAPQALHLQGKSWHTTSAVGPLEIWTGIRPGIDWSVLQPRDRVTVGARAPDR